MTKSSNTLDIDRLTSSLQQYAQELSKMYYVGKVHHFTSIDSTNTWLLDNGKVGDFCISDSQTAGRGRRDNEWVSPAGGNIYLSFCCRFDQTIQQRSLLGLLVGIATAEALQATGVSGHGVKWPNDILWQQKKLGGILIQTRDNSETFIIGVGLNYHLPKESHAAISQSAVSISDVMKEDTPTREAILLSLMQHLLFYTHLFPKLTFPLFLKSWQRWDLLHGQRVTLEHQGEEITAEVAGIDEHGRLALSMEEETRYFSVGDVKLKKRTH